MSAKLSRLVEQISQLPPDWHGAGSVSANVLSSIEQLAQGIGPIEHSVETGAGKTTLLFSHLSADHVVFAVDGGNNSITNTRKSALLNAATVTFVEGPTQRTLAGYKFDRKFNIALIDGPHGWPFPDLEYYHLYPHIESGGLLLVDDIHIPSIHRMFEIIKADEMFELVQIVDNMAMFRRTPAPLFDPLGDGWWLQGYNRACYEDLTAPDSGFKRLAAYVPAPIRKMIPARIKRMVRKVF